MNYITNDTDLTAVANAIRTKGGTSSPLTFPAGFVDAIDNISAGLDNSPVLWLSGYQMESGSPSPNSNSSTGITNVFSFTPLQSDGALCTYGCTATMQFLTDGVFTDYWSMGSENAPQTRNGIVNAGANGAKFTVVLSKKDDAYAYIVDTGEILFAGINSIYHGHRNISEVTANASQV